MYINYEDIKDEVLIDARTKEEFERGSVFNHNIEVINSKQYDFLHKFYPSAFFIILYNMIKDCRNIRMQLMYLSNFCTKKVVIGCSRGRLRSPMLCIYARYLGIDAKVLREGLRKR